MPKELYIYSPLWDFTAETVVKQLNEVPENEELTMRLNTPGGEVAAGWSIISKMSERSGAITGIIDGDVSSMGAILLPFFDNVIANDTSNIMFHKAAWPVWKTPNEAEAKKVKKVNAEFKEKLSKKVEGKDGAKEFLAKVFEPDVRNDVELTAIEAKKLGIVDNVRKLQPKAEYIGTQIVAIVESKKETPSGEIDKSKIKKMDKATLKA
ncbi:ATP-dependent Clp protease proteolytic subunit, partial [Candidatus Pacearchaeota archaeon]|nr:ATP-dependent Clp protease proteolytic subunit [Candidatus Pacearchaeota archaeon]